MKRKIDCIWKRCILAVLILTLLVVSVNISSLSVYAEETDNNFEKVTFSLNSDMVEDSSIDLYAKDSVYYITTGDLCRLTRCKQFIDEETGIISITQGIWKTEFDIINQTFQDGCQTINTTILEVSSNELAVPALMFLNYYQTAEAFIKDETLYCRMTGFTAWETLDVDYNNSLLDIHKLYGGKGNVIFSLSLDVLMDFITGDISTSDVYLSDALLSSLKVDISEYDAVKNYLDVLQNELYSDLHSVEGTDFINAVGNIVSSVSSPTEWYIERFYNMKEKNIVRIAKEAREADYHKAVTTCGEKFYDAVKDKNKALVEAEQFFDNMDQVMFLASVAAETANQMKYVNATNNLVYDVMGTENLNYLGISADDNSWVKLANNYSNVLKTGWDQIESEGLKLFTDDTFWNKLIGSNVSTAAGLADGVWELSLNTARIVAKLYPVTKSTIEGFEADRRAICLAGLQQNVYAVAKTTRSRWEGQKDDPEIYQKYIQAHELYCRVSIALYENLISMVDEFGKDKDYWADLFQSRIDKLAVSLYQLTTIQDDGIQSCLPLDLENFSVNSDEGNIFEELPSTFGFSSGAGAWGTTLHIAADGTFDGQYMDSDMGSTGPGYANGTTYICDFTGKFTVPQKVSENIYSMTLEELNVNSPSGNEYYENEIRYITSDPYGLDNASEFYIFMPGANLDELPEQFLSWSYLNRDIRSTLPFGYYGIYNVGGEEGFVGMSENNIWSGNYMYYYQSRRSALWPSYSNVSHLLFWPEDGAAILDLSFAWNNDDQTEFDAYDNNGTGNYHISVQISEDAQKATVSVTSENGIDFTSWGGTADGQFTAEYNNEL